MFGTHWKACRKGGKFPEQRRGRGRPSNAEMLTLRLPAPSNKNTNHNDNNTSGHSDSSHESGNSDEEDELYGKQVSEDDSLDDAAVLKKPCCRERKEKTNQRPQGTVFELI